MPDFAPSATPRYVAHYRAGGVNHSIMTRGHRGENTITTEARARNVLSQLFTAFIPILAFDFQWLEAFYIPQDTEIGFGSDVPPAVVGTIFVTDMSPQDKITSFTFAGKSSLGSKARISCYGMQLNPDSAGPNIYKDFILLASESTIIADAVNALNGNEVPGIDNGTVLWYPRCTLKMNDHWLKEVRTGGIG